MFVIKYKKIFLALSITLVTIALAAVVRFGLPLGIDFKGGSQLQVTYPNGRPAIAQIKESLASVDLSDAVTQPTGEQGLIIKMHSIDDAQKVATLRALGAAQSVVESSFTTIGPSVGAELRNKAIISVVLVMIAIIIFVAYAFRKASHVVSSWKYGLAVIMTLAHDVIICVGAFAIIGHFTGAEVDTLFVVALLTTLSLSISDTIVVFDRIRENLAVQKETRGTAIFESIVGDSLSQTFVRSINTSLMVFVMVLALAIVGPASTRLFSVMLAIGMFFGTYSSIFLASPLLVLFERAQKKSLR